MSKNKKRLPKEPSQSQVKGTTTRAESHAGILFDRIGTGRDRAVRRPSNSRVDRDLRELIEAANNNGDCIINLGFGYYRPGPDEAPDFRRYIATEEKRLEKIGRKIENMKEAYGRYQ